MTPKKFKLNSYQKDILEKIKLKNGSEIIIKNTPAGSKIAKGLNVDNCWFPWELE